MEYDYELFKRHGEGALLPLSSSRAMKLIAPRDQVMTWCAGAARTWICGFGIRRDRGIFFLPRCEREELTERTFLSVDKPAECSWWLAGDEFTGIVAVRVTAPEGYPSDADFPEVVGNPTTLAEARDQVELGTGAVEPLRLDLAAAVATIRTGDSDDREELITFLAACRTD